MKPFLSIIIPTYNSGEKLLKLIKSIYSQKFKNFEVIVVDDCSKDNSIELIKEFPVHFTLIDGYTASDGLMGCKAKGISVKTHTIIGGANIVSVDHLTAGLIKLKAEICHLFREMIKYLPLSPYKKVGNAVTFEKWSRVPYFIPRLIKKLEYTPRLLAKMGIAFTGGYDDCFPAKKPGSFWEGFFNIIKWPLNHFADYGIITLKRRKRRFRRELSKNRKTLNIIAQSEFLISQLFFLSSEDIDNLIEIFERGLFDKASYSGHYLFLKGKEIPFISRLSTSNQAVVDILNHLYDNKIDSNLFIKELKSLTQLYPGFYEKGNRYSYCFN